ncbi:hypothetical protein [Fulvivirga ligni]|uniref:hypothetical protein n=1 Tax=Fulvivirga ligni TaxID=2904246 RepID=UPI001F2FB8F3|nr:hypothetical protein [Fulvivirga ligni]UII21317.1 hypothetical protein LVD16_26145 [Fulvivirga ligni]
MKATLSRVLFLLTVAYFLFLSVITILLIQSDYNDILTWYQKTYPNAYKIQDFGDNYFTIAHFEWLQSAGWVFVAVFLVAIGLLLFRSTLILKFYRSVLTEIQHSAASVKHSFLSLSKSQTWLFAIAFLVIIGLHTFLFIGLPFHVDEVFSFVYFAHEGPIITGTYLFENNHILYNLATSIWSLVLPPFIASRITSYLTHLLILTAIFSFVNKKINFRAALLCIIFTASSLSSAIYGIQGRSYDLIALLWLVSLISVEKHGKKDKLPALFIICSILGFFSVRLYIYPFTTALLFYVFASFKNQRLANWGSLLKSVFIIGLGSLALYTPAWLVSGTDALFLNQRDHHDLIDYLPAFWSTLSVITEFNSKTYIFVPFLILIAAIFFRKVRKSTQPFLIINGLVLTTLVGLIYVTRTYPPVRTFGYANILFFCTVALVVDQLLCLIKNQMAFYTAILFVILSKIGLFAYGYEYGWRASLSTSLQDHEFYNHLDNIVSDISEIKPKKIYTNNADEYLIFYLRLRDIENDDAYTFISESSSLPLCDMIINYKGTIVPPKSWKQYPDESFGRVYYSQ